MSCTRFALAAGVIGLPLHLSAQVIETIDYSDTFEVDVNGKRPNGAFNTGSPDYDIENAHGNPNVAWTPGSGFSFNNAASAFNPDIIGAATVNDGAATGFAQSGGGDFSIDYGLRDNYTVQFDALFPAIDRLDISSISSAGAGIGGLTVFIRRDSVAGTPHAAFPDTGLPGIGLYNGTTEVPLLDNEGGLILAGVSDDNWHNYAVNFDRTSDRLKIYVDRQELADIDLASFSAGAYAEYPNAAVGIGGSGVDFGTGQIFYYDNFVVGGSGPKIDPLQPLPDPGNLNGLPAGLAAYYDFNEASGPVPGFKLDFAYDRQGSIDGKFQGNATRGAGLIGPGGAIFSDASNGSVSLGTSDAFTVSDGLSVEALILPGWSGAEGNYDQIFRKEDGDSRILLSFQNDANFGGANPPVEAGPVLSFGINVAGAYSELDMPLGIDLSTLDGGLENSGSVYLTAPEGPLGPNDVVLQDGKAHHVVAAYDVASGDKSIFIDGLKRWTVNLGEGSAIATGGAASATIGNSGGGGETFVGTIDEFAFWNRALSAEEIEGHYANMLVGKNYFGTGFALPGDANADGKVDLSDFGILKENFGTGTTAAQGDFNGDSKIDLTDFGILKDNFGKTAGAAVPEPATWQLLMLAGLSLLAVRRRAKA
jgi:hypothetical protein